MKLRVSVALPDGGVHDISLECDVTATAADVAHAFLSAGLGSDPSLAVIARQRGEPITLCAMASTARVPFMIDPQLPIAHSGLRSGWILDPMREFASPGEHLRLTETAGTVTVLDGPQEGVQFSLLPGVNILGRDPGSRVELLDRSVSRRHAQIEVVGEVATLRDLGSANGTLLEGRPCRVAAMGETGEVTLGRVTLRVAFDAGNTTPPVHEVSAGNRDAHTRSPQVRRRFPHTRRELPSPPTTQPIGRIPLVAMIAPVVMGVVLYVATQSLFSLLLIGLTPLMMLGSWLDGRVGGKRATAKAASRFVESLDEERETLQRLREEEIRVRSEESPSTPEIAAAVAGREALLWGRRPEHRTFLEVRLGEGALASRTEIDLPGRREIPPDHWSRLQEVAEEFGTVSPVPVTEGLENCGALGIAGPTLRSEAAARSIIMQIVGLHSPQEVVLACFADAAIAPSWDWLKWLPHVDPVEGILPGWQLVDTARDAAKLVGRLEEVLRSRQRASDVPRSARAPAAADQASHGVDAEQVPPILPVIIVLVLGSHPADPARLIELAERGPASGLHVIWLANRVSDLPAVCRTFLEVDRSGGAAHFVRGSRIVQLSRVEHVDEAVARAFARGLAPVSDIAQRAVNATDLPRSVQLRDVHGVDLLSGPSPIASAWSESGSVRAEWRHGQEREPVSLAAVVGQGTHGALALDLRTHGPHALIGGTTGSGKSEFLQSWIMSLAATIGPDRLNFLMVDYKGGAAFAECVDLPHAVGLVTDLSPHLVHRALRSLRAEIRHREELLAEHGAKDLIAMERRSDPATPPVLVIVIDEFAALVSDVPEFVTGVIDIAQRGRSLGLHLVLATQRPAGVITDNLRANTNLRVALRMADEADSTDVIGIKDAALFAAETPGRAVMKAGAGRLAYFQSGYLGGRANSAPAAAEMVIRSLGFSEGEPWRLPVEPLPRRARAVEGRDIERLRDAIMQAAEDLGLERPRRPWLDELPTRVDLTTLRTDSPEATVIGIRDDPDAQTRETATIDFDDAGHVLICGASGTGKTSALLTLAASLTGDAQRRPVRIYGIDAAGGALAAVEVLPTVSAVAALADTELIERVLRVVAETVTERGPRFARARAASLAAYRNVTSAPPEPRVFLFIDGFAAFRAGAETRSVGDESMQLLSEILSAGRAVGVHVVITSDRPSALPSTMASSVQQRFVMRLANSQDYAGADVLAEPLEAAGPGRALLAGDGREVQIALADGAPDFAAQTAALEALAGRIERAGGTRVPRVVNAPATIALQSLPPLTADGHFPVVGIAVRTLEPAGISSRGLAVVAGPRGSGLTSALRCCAEALERAASAASYEIDSVLLTSSGHGLVGEREWSIAAVGAERVAAVAEQLIHALGGVSGRAGGRWAQATYTGLGAPGDRGAGTEASARIAHREFPRAGCRGLIVVEGALELENTEAIQALVALVKVARRSEVLVVCECEHGLATAAWELFMAIQQPNWGIALQPDQHDSRSPFREDFGRVRRADFPPGRGFLVSDGKAEAVQLAYVPAGSGGDSLSHSEGG